VKAPSMASHALLLPPGFKVPYSYHYGIQSRDPLEITTTLPSGAQLTFSPHPLMKGGDVILFDVPASTLAPPGADGISLVGKIVYSSSSFSARKTRKAVDADRDGATTLGLTPLPLGGTTVDETVPQTGRIGVWKPQHGLDSASVSDVHLDTGVQLSCLGCPLQAPASVASHAALPGSSPHELGAGSMAEIMRDGPVGHALDQVSAAAAYPSPIQDSGRSEADSDASPRRRRRRRRRTEPEAGASPGTLSSTLDSSPALPGSPIARLSSCL